MGTQLDNENYYRLMEGCEDHPGTSSRIGVFRVIDTGTTTVIEFEALWCYVGARMEIQYRVKTKLSDDQISKIEIILEETAWQEAEKVG